MVVAGDVLGEALLVFLRLFQQQSSYVARVKRVDGFVVLDVDLSICEQHLDRASRRTRQREVGFRKHAHALIETTHTRQLKGTVEVVLAQVFGRRKIQCRVFQYDRFPHLSLEPESYRLEKEEASDLPVEFAPSRLVVRAHFSGSLPNVV